MKTKKFPLYWLIAFAITFSACVKKVANESSNVTTTTSTTLNSTSVTQNVPLSTEENNVSPKTSNELLPTTPAPIQQETINEPIVTKNVALPLPTSPQDFSEFTPWNQSEIAQFFEKNTKASEFITITPAINQSFSVEGKEGTVFTMPANAFIDEEGKTVIKPITLEIKECYKMSDILLSNLSTKSGEMPIETGGMVYIQAKSEGKTVKLAANKAIIVEMPTKEKKDRMELFYGNKSQATGVMDWRVADTRIRNNSRGNIGGAADLSLGLKQYDLGIVEAEFGVKTDHRENRMPSAKVNSINPKLKSYKKEIADKLNGFVCERNLQSYRNFRSTHPDYKYFPIAPPLCVAVSELDAAFSNIEKYKNYAFKKNIPFIAVMCKELYYKQVDLLGNTRFDADKWKKDAKFFAENFNLIKESGFDVMAAVDAWREQADQALSEHQAKYAASYLFASNQLGWLNCDRFMPNDGQGRNIFVKCDKNRNLDIKLIFEETKMVFPAFYMGSQLAFTNVPVGKKAKIFGVRTQGKHTEFVIKDIITGQEPVITDLKFEEMSFAQLEKQFEGR